MSLLGVVAYRAGHEQGDGDEHFAGLEGTLTG
jgi:hypothetical protein